MSSKQELDSAMQFNAAITQTLDATKHGLANDVITLKTELSMITSVLEQRNAELDVAQRSLTAALEDNLVMGGSLQGAHVELCQQMDTLATAETNLSEVRQELLLSKNETWAVKVNSGQELEELRGALQRTQDELVAAQEVVVQIEEEHAETIAAHDVLAQQVALFPSIEAEWQAALAEAATSLDTTAKEHDEALLAEVALCNSLKETLLTAQEDAARVNQVLRI